MRQIREGLRPTQTDATLREYLAPYCVWDECPHIARVLTVGGSMGKSHATNSRSRLERFVFTHPIAEVPFAEIRRGDLIDFQMDLVRADVGRCSINQVMGHLKVAFREACNREELDRNPAAGLEDIRYQTAKRGVFTLEELRLLFPPNSHGPWQDLSDHAVLLLAWTTGMRKGELLALRWEHVHLDQRYVERRSGTSAQFTGLLIGCSTSTSVAHWSSSTTSFSLFTKLCKGGTSS